MAIEYLPVGSTFETEVQVHVVNNETDKPLTEDVSRTFDAATSVSWRVDSNAELAGSLPRVPTGAGFEDAPGAEFEITAEAEVPGTAMVLRSIEINSTVEVPPHTALSVILVVTTQKGAVTVSGDASGTLEVEGVTHGRVRYDEYKVSGGLTEINAGMPMTSRWEPEALLPQ